jgi:metal-sulfur cluster biosynthetic enzyme
LGWIAYNGAERKDRGSAKMVSEDVVIEALREVYDPELHYNVYDLGLVYDIGIKDSDVKILMTLTTPMCPIGPMITEQIQETVGLMPGVKNVDVEFTFDPAWSPEKMSDEARADLGLD